MFMPEYVSERSAVSGCLCYPYTGIPGSLLSTAEFTTVLNLAVILVSGHWSMIQIMRCEGSRLTLPLSLTLEHKAAPTQT